ncbi:MAG: 30S ribosomal protein S6e [Candidatus Norongarragalinales archaeon]
MKIVINDVKTGHSFQKEVDKNKEGLFIGKKIGAEFDGGIVGLEGYKLVITGGSDKDGTPMRADVAGQKKASAVIGRGCGARRLAKGVRVKKRVCGNTISANIVQINAKIKDYGSKPLSELGFTPKVKEKKGGEAAGGAGEKKEEKKK